MTYNKFGEPDVNIDKSEPSTLEMIENDFTAAIANFAMVKPTLALFFIIGPFSPLHGYFILNAVCNYDLMVAP